MAEDQSSKPSGVPPAGLTGTRVGRFAVGTRLGAGGMGEVYRAEDTVLRRTVALKRLAPRLSADQDYRRRFLKEAQRASRLNDPHIAAIYDVFEDKAETFLVMEYVEGKTLRELMGQAYASKPFLDVATQCAEALRAAHDKGILHRDLKPENIMVTPQGQIKVLDFGVARELPRSTQTTATVDTETPELRGTPAYMAPEVLLEKGSDERADLFSLGVVFYEMLTARHPFYAGGTVATGDRILHSSPPPIRQVNPQAPEELDWIVAKLLAKSPGERFASAADLLSDLRALERPVYSGTPRLKSEPLPPRPRAPRWRYFALAALLALIAGVAYRLRPVARRVSVGPTAGPAVKRLAVLPFENLSDRSEDEYFADGLADELMAALSRVRSLEVISRTSVMRLKNTSSPVSDIARQLRVGYIVSGSVQRAGTKVRITVALENATRESQMWAQSYDRPFKDILAIQKEVAETVVASLALLLRTDERAALAAMPTRNLQAFDAYLRGKSLVTRFNNRGREADFRAAENALREAIQGDPEMAAAYAEQAWLYYFHDIERARPAPDLERARKIAGRALALDPQQLNALGMLAMMHVWRDEYEKAYSYARKVLELNPHDPQALMVLGACYENWGMLEEALQAYRQAARMDPLYVYPLTNAANVLSMLGRYDEAWEENEAAATLENDNWSVLLTRVRIRYYQGRLDQAGQLAEEAKKGLPDSEKALAEVFLAWVSSQRGEHGRAQAILRRCQGTPIFKASSQFQFMLAEGLALEGRSQESLQILEEVAAKRPNYPWLSQNKNLQNLRGQPRFQALLAKVFTQWKDRQARYGDAAAR